MKSILLCIAIFLLSTVFLFIKDPKISGKIEFMDSAVGIKLEDSKVLPIFHQYRGYNPESFVLNIGNIFFPLTIGPYESFLLMLIQYPFSSSVYLILFFKILLGLALILITFYISRISLTPFILAILLIPIASLIDKNSYYVGSVLILLGLVVIWKKNDAFNNIILLITTLINLKLGISLFLIFLMYSLFNRVNPFPSVFYLIIGSIPSVISFIYIQSEYSKSSYLLAPPNFHFLKLELVDLLWGALIFVPALIYILKKDSKYIYPLLFVVFQFLNEFVFFSHNNLKFLPSLIVSVVVLGEYFKQEDQKLKKIIFIILFVLLFVPIYGMFRVAQESYYPYKYVKMLSDYLVEEGIQNPSLLCDVPLFLVSQGKLRPVYWHYLWDFLREKEKYVYKDFRSLQAIVLKMQRGKHVLVDVRKYDYNEFNMVRIKHHINMRRIKDFTSDNPVFVLAYID